MHLPYQRPYMKFAPQSRHPYVKLLIFYNSLSFSIFYVSQLMLKSNPLFSNLETVLSTKLFQYKLFYNCRRLLITLLSTPGTRFPRAVREPPRRSWRLWGLPWTRFSRRSLVPSVQNQLESFSINKNYRQHRVRNGLLPNAHQPITGDNHDLK